MFWGRMAVPSPASANIYKALFPATTSLTFGVMRGSPEIYGAAVQDRRRDLEVEGGEKRLFINFMSNC